MPQQLRVDTVDVQVMASRWGASVDELSEAVTPTGFGLSRQPSAAAVNAAHADITTFTAALAGRVNARATRVAEADTWYIANEADSAKELAAVADPVIGV
jgi:hypothetical protein